MDIHKEAYKELDKIRTSNQKIKEKRTLEVYKKIPQIQKIDQEISQIGIKITKAALSTEKDIPSMIHLLKLEIDKLKKQKFDLLSKEYSSNYLDLQYSCILCEDTGNINQKRCSCINKIITDKYLEISGTRLLLERENFSTFNLNYYSNEKNIPGTNFTERSYMNAILNQTKLFCENFGKKYENILFSGDPGRGKTFLCNCIAKALTDDGHIVFYSTANRLSKNIESSRFDKDQEARNLLKLYYNAPLLILDDLGSEFSTAATDPEIFNIINTRILYQKPTIISTNLDSKAMEIQYSQRIVSRLFGEYKTFKIISSDIRILKQEF